MGVWVGGLAVRGVPFGPLREGQGRWAGGALAQPATAHSHLPPNLLRHSQIGVALYLWLGLDEPVYAAVLAGLILPQVYAQIAFFLPDTVKNDVAYQASGCGGVLGERG